MPGAVLADRGLPAHREKTVDNQQLTENDPDEFSREVGEE